MTTGQLILLLSVMQMDDRLTAMWGLATLSVGQGGVRGGAGGHSILLMGWLVS